MYDNIKIAVLGGDMRQISVAKCLSEKGFRTVVWGLGDCSDKIGRAVCLDSWEEAVRDSSAVVLPLPASSDGVRVNCPLVALESSEQLKMTKIFDVISSKTLLIGGRFTPLFNSAAESRGIKAIDYFESEELQIKNAIPTAEGALAIAMNKLPITLHGAKAAVVGYGRVGKVVADKLYALGARVTVAARKNSDIAWTYNKNFEALKIERRGGESSLNKFGDGYDVIFNTVPYWIFDEKVLSNIGKDTLIIDLASAPGGIDMTAAQKTGANVIQALALPGKCAPFTAGKIICDSIIDILIKEEII